MDPQYRDHVLVNEVRTELKGSLLAWAVLTLATVFMSVEFADRADPFGFSLWLGTISACLAGWLFAWIGLILRPPPDDRLLERWTPIAKLGITLCNVATAGSVWVFMPVADPELRALMVVLYAWYLIIQFAAATEATQVLASAVILVLGSLTAWLVFEQPTHALKLSLFLLLFGATLIAIRRFVRQAVVQATAARAAADAARRELAVALVELERERDAKTHFIRAASHDLQQPLQAAALFLERVRPGARAADQTSALGGLGKSLEATRRLVDTMLDHLRLDSGAVQPRLVRMTAGEVFDRVLLTQREPAAAAGVDLAVVGRRTALETDPALLTRAVENLVSNAIRHAEARRVVLGARARRGSVEIWVVDDGRGLAEGDEARIFLPFEQGGRVGASGGFGLGLASAAAQVALLSGACGAARGVTRGAAFWIRLPASAHDAVRCAA